MFETVRLKLPIPCCENGLRWCCCNSPCLEGLSCDACTHAQLVLTQELLATSGTVPVLCCKCCFGPSQHFTSRWPEEYLSLRTPVQSACDALLLVSGSGYHQVPGTAQCHIRVGRSQQVWQAPIGAFNPVSQALGISSKSSLAHIQV